MAFTYSGDPANSSADAVRYELGDTNSADAQNTDAEIAYLLSTAGGDVLQAAIRGAELLAAKYARMVDKAAGTFKLSASQKFDHYITLIAALKERAASYGGVTPYAGGISRDDKLGRELDTDRTQPAFSRDMFRYGGFEPNTNSDDLLS